MVVIPSAIVLISCRGRLSLCVWVNCIVTVQVSEVHSTVAAVSSICTKAKECYVDETSAKVCNRMKTTCNPCVSEKENESVFASFAPTEYICFDVNDDGDCPTKTTNCPASMERE